MNVQIHDQAWSCEANVWEYIDTHVVVFLLQQPIDI